MMTSFRSTILTAHAPEQWLINLPDGDFTTTASSCLRPWCGSRVPTGSLTGSGTELSSIILLVLIGRVGESVIVFSANSICNETIYLFTIVLLGKSCPAKKHVGVGSENRPLQFFKSLF